MATLTATRSTWPKGAVISGAVLIAPAAFTPLAIDSLPPWLFMWALAFAVYAGFKLFTFLRSEEAREANWERQAIYLLLWPGMDAEGFFASNRQTPAPAWSEIPIAVAKLLFGITLIGAAKRFAHDGVLLPGWLMLTGVAFSLHFGLMHLLSILWRHCGLNTPPIMRNPLRAKSLSEFWGRRWNLAFRDWVHTFVFLPLTARFGAAVGVLGVFVFSGFIHDFVISTAAGGGYGLPMLYFLIQAAAFFFERSRVGKRLGLNKPIPGWLFTVTFVVAPAGLLFHPQFLETVVVPMLRATPLPLL